MSDSSGDTGGSGTSLKSVFGLDQYRFTRVKLLGLAIGLLFIILGVFSSPSGNEAKKQQETTSQSAGSSSSNNPFINNLVEIGPQSNQTTPDEAQSLDRMALGDYSPLFVKGGFGMFIGFAIGFAIRAFIRLAIIMSGVFFILIAMAGYVGWVEIHWQVISQDFNQIVGNLGAQFASFKAFLNGAIPTTGMTATGLALGLKRG